MDKKTIVHATAEVVVLSTLTIYLINRISALENRVAELEKDNQAIAMHTVKVENGHANAIKQLAQVAQRQVTHTKVEDANRRYSQHEHVQTPTNPQQKRPVRFSDDTESETDDDSSEELPMPPPPKPKSKSNKSKKGIKVRPSGQKNDTMSSRKGMDDVKNQAEYFRKAAEEEL